MTPRIWTYLSFIALTGYLVAAFGTNAGAQGVLGTPGSAGPDPFRITFDENGKASFIDTNGSSGTLQGTLTGVPGSANLVLQFTLPEPVVTGTVSFTEPGGGTSDWLQFTDANFSTAGMTAGSMMIYTSDLPEGGEVADLADTGPPPLPAGNFLQCGVSSFCAGEVGPEGNNGFEYRPGGVAYPANDEYSGISDAPAVPEPPSFALLGSGIAATGVMMIRRRRRKAV
jgi:hypothetical protein